MPGELPRRRPILTTDFAFGWARCAICQAVVAVRPDGTARGHPGLRKKPCPGMGRAVVRPEPRDG